MNALPPSLVRFESQLEDAVRRDRRRRPRRLAFRIALVGAATAAIAFGALSLLPGDDPSAVARASAALNPSGDTIVHTVVLTKEAWPDGELTTTQTETWKQSSYPFDHRKVMSGRELGMAGGRPEAYVARTNTIYTLVPGSPLPPPEKLRDHDDEWLDRMRYFLRSGQAREEGRVTVDGRAAVRIVVPPTVTLLVDAESGRPIESRSISDEGVRVTTRFRTYEVLPATEANLALVSIRRQHPRAAVKPGITFEGFGPDPRKRK